MGLLSAEINSYTMNEKFTLKSAKASRKRSIQLIKRRLLPKCISVMAFIIIAFVNAIQEIFMKSEDLTWVLSVCIC